MRCASKLAPECLRSALRGCIPNAIFGTKSPSITSKWSTSAPALQHSRAASASAPKSAESSEGAILTPTWAPRERAGRFGNGVGIVSIEDPDGDLAAVHLYLFSDFVALAVGFVDRRVGPLKIVVFHFHAPIALVISLDL